MKDTFSTAEPRVVDCRPGFSLFFDLIRQECNDSGNLPLHRICSLMRKMGVQCFTREDLVSNQEIQEEQQSAQVRTDGGAVALSATRFTFFRQLPAQMDWHDLAGKECLGYAVLISLTLPDNSKKCYILESVVRIPSIWALTSAGLTEPHDVTNYYVHSCKEFETVIGTATQHFAFNLTGSFFCQQNDLTHVCAHAALRTGINSSPAYNGPKLTNKSINDVLGIDHTNADGKRVGKYPQVPAEQSIGLTTEQIVKIVQFVGWKEHVAEFYLNPAIDYEAFIYPMIESGCPTILGVENVRTAHVLAVIGHTWNSDRWSPEASHGYGAFPINPYISSSAWADHFIVSDDNFGMYSTVPTEAIRNILVPKHNPNLHASLAIGMMPAGVTISGYGAEQKAAGLASKVLQHTQVTTQNKWLGMLQNDPSQKLVCRTLLGKKAEYISAMSGVADDQGKRLTQAEIARLQACLPDRFWITELTVPNLYTANKRKLGDIISPASGSPQDFMTGAMTVFFWFPGLSWHEGSPALLGWSLFSHIPILRGASQNRKILEW
jgi:hypothetical protein